MKPEIAQAIQAELEQVKSQDSEGLLKASAVVAFARDPKTALHSQFEWDDSVAAAQYRVDQARFIIQRVYVTVIEEPAIEHRAFVSLVTDRTKDGGYRTIGEVMSSPTHRQTYVRQALDDVTFWRKKYEAIAELQPVFAAMDEVAAKLPQPEVANLKVNASRQIKPSVVKTAQKPAKQKRAVV